MSTAQVIKQWNPELAPEGRRKRKARGRPFAKANTFGVESRFKCGQSGNPGGLPGTDLAALYARRFFERHPEGISRELAHELKGFNAYAFSILADRAYGKVAEKRQVEHTSADGAPLKIVVELVNGTANEGTQGAFKL